MSPLRSSVSVAGFPAVRLVPTRSGGCSVTARMRSKRPRCRAGTSASTTILTHGTGQGIDPSSRDHRRGRSVRRAILRHSAARGYLPVDPQQRLLLEVAWEAFEHAGVPADRLLGSRTGVFVGICASDYMTMQMKWNDPERDRGSLRFGHRAQHGGGTPVVRVSACRGRASRSTPSCSSSLVAIHLACQSLRLRECGLALAGGVHLCLSPEAEITMSKARMLAADGKCKTFDASADGFVEGEGCGIVVLKRLSEAVADGDRIIAVIRGSGVNQDGPSSGLTVPNGPAQEAVIRAALDMAGSARQRHRLRGGPRNRHAARRPDRGSGACRRSRRRPAGRSPARHRLVEDQHRSSRSPLRVSPASSRSRLRCRTARSPGICISASPTRTFRGTRCRSKWRRRIAHGPNATSRGRRASAPSGSAAPTRTCVLEQAPAPQPADTETDRPLHV